MRKPLLSIVLLISLVSAQRPSPFNGGDIILQAAPVMGLQNGTSNFYWGGMITANYFPSFSEGYLGAQVVIGGGEDWFEMSPGTVFGPLGVLLIRTADDGESFDFKGLLAGVLLFTIALENPIIHIPIGKKSTISPSLHLFRMRYDAYEEWEYGGGLGIAYTTLPKKNFVITLFTEAGLQYYDGAPWGVKAGIRIGGVFPSGK